jgi:hypothetical protein
VLVALAAPVVFDHDSFPLSTYPMYSSARSNETAIPTAIGIDRAGVEHRLSLQLIGANDDPLIAVSDLRTAIAADRTDMACRRIAARATGRGFIAVEVVTERHDVVDQVMGKPSLKDRETHSRCEVIP